MTNEKEAELMLLMTRHDVPLKTGERNHNNHNNHNNVFVNFSFSFSSEDFCETARRLLVAERGTTGSDRGQITQHVLKLTGSSVSSEMSRLHHTQILLI